MPTDPGRDEPTVDRGTGLGERETGWLDGFDRLAPYLQQALVLAGTHDLEDVRRALSQGRMQLWPGLKSAIVTQIVDHPQRRELVFFLAAGNLPEIQALYPIVLQWGAMTGCTHAVFMGRLGWSRTFLTKHEGWQLRMAVFEKDLNGGENTGSDDHSTK
jgi:hypothetical protein